MSKYKGLGISKGKTPDGLVYFENVGRKKTGGIESLGMHDTMEQARKAHKKLMKEFR